jgi:ubiquitin C-terminal hydrolase
VYLNVSGVGVHTDRNKKTYTVKSVPLTVTPTALGHVDFTGLDYYQLVCVWCHQGASFRSGHWISYVNKNEQWYEVDKEVVTPKRFEEIPFRFAYACGEQV